MFSLQFKAYPYYIDLSVSKGFMWALWAKGFWTVYLDDSFGAVVTMSKIVIETTNENMPIYVDL